MTRYLHESDLEWSRRMFNHLQRLEKRIMAPDSYMSADEWSHQDLDTQESYYRWVCGQAGELCDLI